MLLAGDLILGCSHPPAPTARPRGAASPALHPEKDQQPLAGKVRVLEGTQGGQHPGFCYLWDLREQQRTLENLAAGERKSLRAAVESPILGNRLLFHTSATKLPIIARSGRLQCGYSSPGNASRMWAGAMAGCSGVQGGGQGPISRY